MEKGKLHYLYIHDMFVSTIFNAKLFFKYVPNKVQLYIFIDINQLPWYNVTTNYDQQVSSKYSDFADKLDYSKTFFF